MISTDGAKSLNIQLYGLQNWLKVTKNPDILSFQSHLSSKSQQYDHYQEDDLDLRPDLPRPLGQRCWSLTPTKDLI